MAQYFLSNCSTLNVGCYLYNGPGLTNPVSDGYYSNGTDCYTVTGGSGYISSISACGGSNFITISPYVPGIMTCFQNYTFAALASAVVDTNVQVEIVWYGDLGGSISQYVTIFAGQSCNSVSVFSGGQINCNGEFFSIAAVTLSPSSYNTQIYQVGTTETTPFYPC